MFLIDLFKWWGIDIYRHIKSIIKKEEKRVHLYGIYGFFGLPGKGKTMALTYELNRLRKKYGDKIYIATNYFYKDQDFAFKHWRDLLKTYDKPLVVAWDEVQNEFNSREFKNFPVELLTILTQNRKGNGIRIYYTAQRYDRVDKIFRELTHQAIECNTILGRWTKLRYYHWLDYAKLNETVDIDVRRKIRPIKKVNFVQTDELRDMYDSFKMLDSAKSKTYIGRDEMVKLI